ncbi:MAG: hypothetical protein NE330_08925 [Lentisphaeraceae bacterium]|nr:hypothetical protein [Lentisphaeraceae bacterium]
MKILILLLIAFSQNVSAQTNDIETILLRCEESLFSLKKNKLTRAETALLNNFIKKHDIKSNQKITTEEFNLILLKCRCLAVTGQEETAVTIMEELKPLTLPLMERMAITIEQNQTLSPKTNAIHLAEGILMPGVYLTRGIVRATMAIKFKREQNDKQAKELIIGRTGAAVHFYLGHLKGESRKEAELSRKYYSHLRFITDKWFNRKLKAIE